MQNHEEKNLSDKFSDLKKACERNPEVQLNVNQKPTRYVPFETGVKNGFVKKFGK